jgi:MATE family multidrug resistance protein
VLIGLLNMAMSMADMLMLGRHDPEGLAAAVVVSDVYSIVFNFSAGFAGVVTPRVAYAIGAGYPWHACTIVRRALHIVLAVNAAGALLILLSASLLTQLGMAHAERVGAYAPYMAATYLFMVLFALVRATLSAMGRPALAVVAIVAAVPVKIAANYAFIQGGWGAPALGVEGAGLASLLVSALMGGSLTLYLLLSSSFAPFDRPEPGTHKLDGYGLLARSGLLMGLIAVSETGVFLASTVVIGLLAPADLIVHALTFRSIAVGYLLVAGVGQAVTIRMAQLHGGTSLRRKAHAEHAMTSCCIALVALLLAVLVGGSRPLGWLLSHTVHAQADIAAHISALLWVAGPTLAALVPAHLITAVLRARNDVAIPTVLTLAAYWGIALTVMMILAARGLGAWGAWFGLLSGATAASSAFLVYFRGRELWLWTGKVNLRLKPC